MSWQDWSSKFSVLAPSKLHSLKRDWDMQARKCEIILREGASSLANQKAMEDWRRGSCTEFDVDVGAEEEREIVDFLKTHTTSASKVFFYNIHSEASVETVLSILLSKTISSPSTVEVGGTVSIEKREDKLLKMINYYTRTLFHGLSVDAQLNSVARQLLLNKRLYSQLLCFNNVKAIDAILPIWSGRRNFERVELRCAESLPIEQVNRIGNIRKGVSVWVSSVSLNSVSFDSVSLDHPPSSKWSERLWAGVIHCNGEFSVEDVPNILDSVHADAYVFARFAHSSIYPVFFSSPNSAWTVFHMFPHGPMWAVPERITTAEDLIAHNLPSYLLTHFRAYYFDRKRSR